MRPRCGHGSSNSAPHAGGRALTGDLARQSQLPGGQGDVLSPRKRTVLFVCLSIYLGGRPPWRRVPRATLSVYLPWRKTSQRLLPQATLSVYVPMRSSSPEASSLGNAGAVAECSIVCSAARNSVTTGARSPHSSSAWHECPAASCSEHARCLGFCLIFVCAILMCRPPAVLTADTCLLAVSKADTCRDVKRSG
jgi:hypothetical protein